MWTVNKRQSNLKLIFHTLLKPVYENPTFILKLDKFQEIFLVYVLWTLISHILWFTPTYNLTYERAHTNFLDKSLIFQLWRVWSFNLQEWLLLRPLPQPLPGICLSVKGLYCWYLLMLTFYRFKLIFLCWCKVSYTSVL